MLGRVTAGWLVWVGVVVWSCGAGVPPSTGVWVAAPAVAEAEHRQVRIRVEPRKGQNAYFSAFLLTLDNGGETDVSIDWNASRYLYNGRPQGPLVFAGIDPQAVKNEAVPEEPVPSGTRFTRDVMPLRLIAWAPLNEKTALRRGITPGMMPGGENGIRLVLRQGDERAAIPLTVRIFRETTP